MRGRLCVFYENDGSSLNEFGTNTAFTLGNATIELYLPAGFSLADRAASTIIDVGTGTLTVSDATLTALASNLRIIRGGERYAATGPPSPNLTMAKNSSWRGRILALPPVRCRVRFRQPPFSCTDGKRHRL